MRDARRKRLVVAFVWLGLVVAGAITWKMVFGPPSEDELVDDTSSASRYKHSVKIAADSFSGYAVLRSDTMKGALRKSGIKLEVVDDKADYDARLAALDKGKVQMAVFTVDSLLTSGAKLGRFPGAIVMVIDETQGADAVVAYKDQIARIQDLDDPEARLVLTPNSPSEFLARVVLAHFQLPSLPEKWWIEADGAGEVYKKFKSGRGQKRAYVMWEPYVSKALQEKDAHILLDSGKLRGYIVDVLVAQREFISKHPDLVAEVVKAYLRAAYLSQEKTNGLLKLVMADAKAAGDPLTAAQAQTLVNGVQWKNTLENYAYFGLVPEDQRKGVQHLEDVVDNITKVLLKTASLKRDPLEGRANTLFYDGTMRSLQGADFHPAKAVNLIEGLGAGTDNLKTMRKIKKLPALNEGQWNGLSAVGHLRVDPISFSRGGARLTLSGERDLDELAIRLRGWPNYYLKVTGHARAEGDPDANLRLAWQRAEAAVGHLVKKGVGKSRVRAFGAQPSGGGGASQSVSFIVGEPNY
jgi:ABC-type nitrate/sulfonate/bicarbonate transport system substrate-binding protein